MRWLAVAIAICLGCRTAGQAGELVIDGDTIMLDQRAGSPASTPILILALDGVSRDLLYDLLRDDKLPHLAELRRRRRPRTRGPRRPVVDEPPVDDDSGVVGGVHGHAGGGQRSPEQRVLRPRDQDVRGTGTGDVRRQRRRRFEVYTEGLRSTGWSTRPSVYERIHAADPNALIWVVLSHFFRGADDDV